MPEEVISREDPTKESREGMLIRRIQNGEHELFYELIRPYERRVFTPLRLPSCGTRRMPKTRPRKRC